MEQKPQTTWHSQVVNPLILVMSGKLKRSDREGEGNQGKNIIETTTLYGLLKQDCMKAETVQAISAV